MPISVAIDGPSGAGKSTIARSVASELKFIYVDTGAMYRSVGLYVFEQGIESGDRAGILSVLKDIHIDIRFAEGSQRILLNGRDVSEEIRKPEISKYASDVSAITEVRSYLLELQRSLARQGNVIMDGRDIGTVVLPEAQIKIFLTATPEDRAQRRYEELRGKKYDVTYAETLAALVERDYNDSSREAAPLRPAEDAIIVDTTGNRLETSIRIIRDIISERIRACHLH